MALVVRLARRQAAAAFVSSSSSSAAATATARLASRQTSPPATRRLSSHAALVGTLLEPRAPVSSPPAPPTLAAPDAAPDADALKRAMLAPETSFREAQQALQALRSLREPLREKHFLALMQKALAESRDADVTRAFGAFEDAVARGAVQLPPRADRTWDYVSFERLQMHRCVLWAMLGAKRPRRMLSFFREHVRHRPNKSGLYESDPLNFLLRVECTGRFAGEDERALQQRVDAILRQLERRRLNTSYSSAHALFRFMLYHPAAFVAQEHGEHASASGNATLADVFVRYWDRYPTALHRDPKRVSLAISAAAAAGHPDVVQRLLADAEAHAVAVDAAAFAHAVECAESADERIALAERYVRAAERNAVYTTRDAPSSISNYLLLYAVYDGNLRHALELLHEMQLHGNAASNRTAEMLFESVAKVRAQIRREADAASSPSSRAAAAQQLAESPSVEDLLRDFPDVIPRNVHTLSQSILQSLRGGDLLVALRLLRSAVHGGGDGGGVALRREVFAQLLYPLLARGSAQYDELELLEVERLYDAQHPGARAYVNAQVLNLCDSNDDFVAMLACLDRWQQQQPQHHAPLSRRALQRVFDIVSRQLQRLRGDNDPDSDDSVADAAAAADELPGVVVEGLELSFRAVLQRYADLLPPDAAWPFDYAVVRSGTSGLRADVALLLQQAHSRGLVLERSAYNVALRVLGDAGDRDTVRECVAVLEQRGVYASLLDKFPDLQPIAERSGAAAMPPPAPV
ncbi:hypothetical protein PybrP1_001921 [[Pythium] brassicae (nom. inval.)]|nr:hypothetical protein PybrP1_001921 [[Pythium] brassicae (nom. inval.)]